MSTTDQINNLIAGCTDLKTFFEGEQQELINARENLLNELSTAIYVDEANPTPGGGDGSLQAPYDSLDTAIDAVAPGQSAIIKLLSNGHMNNAHSNPNGIFRFEGMTGDGSGNAVRVITFQSLASNATSSAGIAGARLAVDHNFIDLQMSGYNPDGSQLYFAGAELIVTFSQSCNIDGRPGAGDDVALMNIRAGMGRLALSGTTYADMGGRWISNVPAGQSLDFANTGVLVDADISNA